MRDEESTESDGSGDSGDSARKTVPGNLESHFAPFLTLGTPSFINFWLVRSSDSSTQGGI